MTLPTKMHINGHLDEDVAETVRSLMADTGWTALDVIHHFFRDIKKWDMEEQIELHRGTLQKPDGTVIKRFKKKIRFKMVGINRS